MDQLLGTMPAGTPVLEAAIQADDDSGGETGWPLATPMAELEPIQRLNRPTQCKAVLAGVFTACYSRYRAPIGLPVNPGKGHFLSSLDGQRASLCPAYWSDEPLGPPQRARQLLRWWEVSL